MIAFARLHQVDEDLVERCIDAVRAYEADEREAGAAYPGVTAEQLLIDAGLTEREQIRHMGLVLDRIRAESGEAPEDSTRTSCHWCRRKFPTSAGRGIHESGCRETRARNRRIVAAFEAGRSGVEIAAAEGMTWSAVYRILRIAGATKGQRSA